jgi:hypothetical protein
MVPALPEKDREQVKVRAGAKKENKQTSITLNPDREWEPDREWVQEKVEVHENMKVPETGRLQIKTDKT